MQVNTEKWGQETEWQVETNLSSASWQDTNLLFYNGKYTDLRAYRTNSVFDYNTPIDYSIAYSAHAADTKMPLADIAIYDYQGTKKYSLEANNGWFLANQNTESSQVWDYYHLLSAFESGSPASLYELGGAYRWNPDAVNYSDIYPRPYNPNRLLRPIVKFSPKSFFGVIYCEIIKNDYTTVSTVSLKELKNNIASYQNEYFIAKAYMKMYAYNGRASLNGNYNNYALKSLNNLGVATTTPIPIGNKELTTYYATVGSNDRTFPIAGTLTYNRSYSGHCGVQIKPQTTDSGGGSEWLQGVAMAHLVQSTHVDYFYSNIYGYMYVLQIKIPITNEVIDELYKGAAAYGLFFSDDVNGLNADTSNVARWLNENMYCGVLDENGVGHGEFTKGFGNAANPVFLWDSNQDSPYDYTKPPVPIDTNTYSVTTGFNTVGNVASTTKAYVINGAGLQGLSSELWTILDNLLVNPSDIENLYNMSLDTFLTNNPIDAIVSLKKFPLSSVPHGENLENVYLGKVQTGAAAYPLAMQQARYNFEAIPIFPKFGDCFLDYSPYTKMQLYVPFCGTIDIDAADFMGRNLSVEMVIDFITGTVTAYVLANQLVVTSLTGTCAIDIPITGTEQATVNSAYESAAIRERENRNQNIMTQVGFVRHPIKTALNPLSSMSKDITTKLSHAQAEYELTHINLPLRQIGNASPLNSWALEFVCRLIIYYPDGECITFNSVNEPSLIAEKVESFGAVNGFATVETATLNNFTGYTQVSDVDLSGVSATDTEKEMMMNLLQTGVYI